MESDSQSYLQYWGTLLNKIGYDATLIESAVNALKELNINSFNDFIDHENDIIGALLSMQQYKDAIKILRNQDPLTEHALNPHQAPYPSPNPVSNLLIQQQPTGENENSYQNNNGGSQLSKGIYDDQYVNPEPENTSYLAGTDVQKQECNRDENSIEASYSSNQEPHNDQNQDCEMTDESQSFENHQVGKIFKTPSLDNIADDIINYISEKNDKEIDNSSVPQSAELLDNEQHQATNQPSDVDLNIQNAIEEGKVNTVPYFNPQQNEMELYPPAQEQFYSQEEEKSTPSEPEIQTQQQNFSSNPFLQLDNEQPSQEQPTQPNIQDDETMIVEQPPQIPLEQQIQEASSSQEKLQIIKSSFNEDYDKALNFLSEQNILNQVKLEKAFKMKALLIKANLQHPLKCQKALMDLQKDNPFEAFCLFLDSKDKVDVMEPNCLNNLQTLVVELVETAEEEFIEDLCILNDNLENRDFDEFLKKVIDLNKKDYPLLHQLYDSIKKNCPKLEKKIQIISQRENFMKFMGEQGSNDVVKKLVEYIINNNEDPFIDGLEMLLMYDQTLRLKFVQGVFEHFSIKLPPAKEFLLSVTDDNVEKARKTLSLFQRYLTLKTDQKLNDLKEVREEFSILLNQLNHDDYEFFSQIIKHFKENILTMGINIPKTFIETREETLNLIILNLFSKDKSEITIQEYYEIDSNFNPFEEEKALIEEYQSSQSLNIVLLKRVIFHYIKRRIDLNCLIKKFKKNSLDFPYTRSILLNFIFNNATTDLKILLVMCCSLFQPFPLNKRFLNEKIDDEFKSTNQFQIYEEISLLYEGYKSILSFCHQDDAGRPKLRNHDTLINLAMLKNFEGLNETYSNFDCLEIQFDYNLANPLHIPVSNYHGQLTNIKLKSIKNLFNIFVIHAQIRGKQEWKGLNEKIKLITDKRNDPLLIIIINHSDHVKQYEQDNIDAQNLEKVARIHKIILFKVKTLSSMDDQIMQNLAEDLRAEFLAFLREENKNYESNIKKRIASIKNFLQILQDNKQPISSIKDCLDTTTEIINLIIKNDYDLHSKEFLPMNSIFSKFCLEKLEKEKNSENYSAEQNIQSDLRAKKLNEELNKQEETQIIKYLRKIINNREYSGAAFSILSKIIKGYLDEKMQGIYAKRKMIKSQREDLIQQIGDDQTKITVDQQEQLDSFNFQLQRINGEISSTSFSYEYLIREFYLHGTYKNDINKKDTMNHMFRRLSEYMINTTHPFEIIDGNNLQFITNVYEQIFEYQEQDNDEIFVISVLGPQSTGKSLLFNFLFGTLFKSSEGRCTKGVYGAMFKVYTQNGTSKRILILDTEGIQAAEGRDEEFDRRIVFYILCVSNLVLICNKGEMNAQMAEILKLAAETISKLQENIMQSKVLVVMNALTATNPGALQESIQKLSSSISCIDQDNSKTQKLFQINEENVTMLPFAFYKSGQKEFIINQPSEEFSEKLEPLKQKIYALMREHFSLKENVNKKSSKEWFQFASEIWDLSEKQKGYREYKTLHQKQQEMKLRAKIETMVEQNFECQEIKEKNTKDIKEIIEIELKKYEGQSNISFEKINAPIEMIIIEKKYDKIDYDLNQEFEGYCKELNITMEMFQKYNIQLKKKLCFQKDNWMAYLKQKVTEFQKYQSETNGLAKLNQIIQELLKDKQSYTKEEAFKLATKSWEQIEEEIMKNLRKSDEIHYTTFHFIKRFYEQQLKQNSYSHNDEIDLLNDFYKKGDQAIFQYLKRIDKFLFYDQMRTPNRERFLQTLEINKPYIQNVQKQHVQKVKHVYIYDWRKLLFERLDLGFISRQLQMILSKEPSFFGKYFTNREESFLAAKQDFFSSFKKELRDMSIEVDPTFQDRILKKSEKIGIKNPQWTFKMQEYITFLIKSEENCPFSIRMKEFWYIHFNPEISYAFLNRYYLKNQHDKWELFNREKYITIKYINEDLSFSEKKLKISDEKEEIVIDKDRTLHPDAATFLKYLCNIKNSSYDYYNIGRCTVQGIQYVQSLMQIKFIVRKIEEIVLKQLLAKGKVENDFKIYDIAQDLFSNTGTFKMNQFVKLDNGRIQEIAKEVKSFISEMNEDFSRFLMRISEQGEAFLHLIAQTYLSALSIQLQIQIEREPIYSMREVQQNQIDMFIAKLTSNDQELDKQVAQQISKKCYDIIQDILQLRFKSRFQEQLKSMSNIFVKKNMITNIEALAQEYATKKIPIKSLSSFPNFKSDKKTIFEFLKADFKIDYSYSDSQIQQITEYYINPRTFFQNAFDVLWDGHIDKYLREYIKDYQQTLEREIGKIIQFFRILKDKLQDKNAMIPSISIFQPTNETSNNIKFKSYISSDEHLMRKNLSHKAASKYLRLMIKNKYNSMNKKLQEQSRSANYMKVIDGIMVDFGNETNFLPTNDELDCDFMKEAADVMIQILSTEKISSIMNFVKFMVQNLCTFQLVEIDTKKLENIFLENLLLKYRAKFTGCLEFCPLCRMQCDDEHKEDEEAEDIIHKCTFGHRIQGFGGNKQSDDNACTISCNHLKNDTEVVYLGSTQKWSQFKNSEALKSWSFEINSGSLQSNTKKNSEIWNHFGRLICEIYNSKQNLKINFVEANQQTYQKIHYLLCLDESGSMRFQNRWTDLMNSVKSFLKKLCENPTIRSNSFVSVVNHSEIARTIFTEQYPDEKLCEKIDFKSGENDFDAALKMSADIISSCINKYDKHILCFMTDGEWTFPETQVRRISSDPLLSKKIQFRGLLYGNTFGNGKQILSDMCSRLSGTFEESITVTALTTSFFKLIPNIYSSQ